MSRRNQIRQKITKDQKEFVREIKTKFSNKSKTADIKWKIEIFRQGKKHIANLMIKFEALVIKVEIDDIHAIFLLKKNIQTSIIKTILEYPLIVVPEILREQKVIIISVRQKYEFTES